MNPVNKKALILAAGLCAWLSVQAAVPHRLNYDAPAADNIVGWERQSLPVGCGHFGWNIFGIVTNERVQVTHNAVLTKGNLCNALEVRLAMPSGDVTGYRRWLDVDDSLAGVEYVSGGVKYTREFFASYPDRVGVMHLKASERGKLEFVLSAEVPFQRPFGDKEGRGRQGKVSVREGTLEVFQELDFYGVKFGAAMRIVTDGRIEELDGALKVSGAGHATVFFACQSNYRLCKGAFVRKGEMPEHLDNDVLADSVSFLNAAMKRGYDEVKRRHLADYRGLAGRVKLDLGADKADAAIPVPKLLERYRKGNRSAYLEETYFFFGRYLLVSSSRPGTLPANLQGVWSGYDKAPWGAGYWYNINVQMNYWPAFSTNLDECFRPLADFDATWRPLTRTFAIGYARTFGRSDLNKKTASDDIWCIGTANRPYFCDPYIGGHSGPGTGGLTSRLYKDWWDFTQDRSVLEKHAHPVLRGMAEMLSHCVCEYDGLMLSGFSASPEQMINGRYVKGGKMYHTVGCAFDQQMIDQNNRDFLEVRQALGLKDDAIAARVRSQIGKYDPVVIGWSGQLKEYREEGYYGSIGDHHHRHISHLVGLMPGNIVTRKTPAWLDAAKVSLDGRGDKSTGWALAHRLCSWARALEGDRSFRLLSNLLAERTYDNLWDAHPPYQIDGNLGAVAGMAEMLIQSHVDGIDLLPALPKVWSRSGSFTGLRARGAYTVECSWRSGTPVRAVVRADRPGKPPVVTFASKTIPPASASSGSEWVYTAFPAPSPVVPPPGKISVDRTAKRVTWKPSAGKGVKYRVLRNIRSAPDYTVVADALTGNSCVDDGVDFTSEDYVTYKVVAVAADGSESKGRLHTCSRATQIEKQRYVLQARQVSGVSINIKNLD